MSAPLEPGADDALPTEAVPAAVPTPTEPGWRELRQVVSLSIASGLLLGCTGGALASVVLTGRTGVKPNSLELVASPFTLIVVLADGLVAVWLVREIGCRKFGRTLRAGVGLVRPSTGWLVSAPVVGLLLAAGAFLLPRADGAGGPPIQRVMQGSSGFVFVIVSALLLPPVEEIYYRGFLQPVFRRAWGPIASVAVITTWFGLVHAPQLFGAWPTLAWVGLAGLVFTLQRELSGGLIASVLTHWTYNAAVIAPTLLAAANGGG